jgi:putative transposase
MGAERVADMRRKQTLPITGYLAQTAMCQFWECTSRSCVLFSLAGAKTNWYCEKVGGPLLRRNLRLQLGGGGRLSNAAERRMAIELISEANAAGASLVSACCELGLSLRTLKRWRRGFMGDGDGVDRRKGSPRLVSHRLSEEERQRILHTCNQPEYASLPPGQIVPALADQGLYIGSESSCYRIFHEAGQCQRSGRARSPQEPRPVPRLNADGLNQV